MIHYDFGKVLRVLKSGNLLLEKEDGTVLTVSSRHCSVPAEKYVGKFYTYDQERDIVKNEKTTDVE